jgi:tetratricopeptide (TPR) repeat protein
VKADPENPAAWVNLAYAVRRAESILTAEAILLKARALHPENALIAFNLACYASVAGDMEEAKARLQHAIDLDNVRRRPSSAVGLDRSDFLIYGRDHSPIWSRCSHWRKSPR